MLESQSEDVFGENTVKPWVGAECRCCVQDPVMQEFELVDC